MPEYVPLSHQQVRCPHCGALADRYHLDLSQFSAQIAQRCAADDVVTRTVCDRCDYLMVLCTQSDVVVDAYMAGF
ncbi:MAG: pyruvate formate lyase-activating protein [Moorea sp. SIO3C2]|nr:pyruvate formate lyase-activating protein [Moorena sp. SIO3C2]